MFFQGGIDDVDNVFVYIQMLSTVYQVCIGKICFRLSICVCDALWLIVFFIFVRHLKTFLPESCTFDKEQVGQDYIF